MKTPNTGGQQANPKIDARKTKESKGRDKRKGKKPKVTFAQLLEKYQKISEEKNAYRPSNSKASRSPLGANLRNGIGKVISSIHHTHILILGRQYQHHGYLPMLI